MDLNRRYTVALHNLGCKVNAYEGEAMLGELQRAGFSVVPWEESADVYIINTCSVTNIADRKSRQMLHKARAKNPAAVVVGAGCYVQARAEELKRDAAVDILIGNNRKREVAEILTEYLKKHGTPSSAGEERTAEEKAADVCGPQAVLSGGKAAGQSQQAGTGACAAGESCTERADAASSKPTSVSSAWEEERPDAVLYLEDLTQGTAYEEFGPADRSSRARVFLKVQDGCNQFCSYCIIPHVRGRIRSRSLADAVREAEAAAAAGYSEVVLTGIHLSSYGADFANKSYEYSLRHDAIPSEALLELIEAVAAVPGIARVRLGSLEPRIVTEEFARRLRAIPEICPHFHLSLQSGCDRTLRAMNRHYTAAQFRESCHILRAVFENPAITTDVITGFPGETEEDFEASYRFVEEIGFYELHVFKYSRRAGTPADRMPGQLTDRVKAERSDRLIELDERQSEAFRRRFLGQSEEVLIEELTEVDGRMYLTGFNRAYVRYLLPVADAEKAAVRIGAIIKVTGLEICKTCILAKSDDLI